MNVFRMANDQFRLIIAEFARFGTIGIAGVVITDGGYGLLHDQAGLGAITGSTVATIVATAVSYIANRYWSFRHRERRSVPGEVLAFAVLNGIALLVQDAVVGASYYLLGQHGKAAEYVALNLGIGLATLFRFWSYRKWVWRRTQTDSSSGQQYAAPQLHRTGAGQGDRQQPPLTRHERHRRFWYGGGAYLTI